jgi:membrane protein implicated in regulation of membrane protease activity
MLFSIIVFVLFAGLAWLLWERFVEGRKAPTPHESDQE